MNSSCRIISGIEKSVICQVSNMMGCLITGGQLENVVYGSILRDSQSDLDNQLPQVSRTPPSCFLILCDGESLTVCPGGFAAVAQT